MASGRFDRKKEARRRRKLHVRKIVSGTTERPRLVVNRSLRYTVASLVDDTKGVTLFGMTTKNLNNDEWKLPEKPEEFKVSGKKLPLQNKVADAFRLGMAVAAEAKEKGIKHVVFDRNGLRYHGRVRAVAEGARKGGLEL